MSSTPIQQALPTVLLAEDSKTAAVLIARYLKDHYNVVLACDGEDAWSKLCANSAVDLVITDVQMPRMTGHELLLKIRASDNPQLRSVPVIIMTSAEESAERDLAFANGASDFLTKPVDRAELQARASVHKKLIGSNQALATNRQALQEQTTIDALTQLKNRRAFLEIAEGHLSLARRHKHDLSVVAVELKKKMKIKKAHGQAVADSVLADVAQILAATTRTEDTSARIGEERFAILLPSTNGVGAVVLAERIRGGVEKKTFSAAGAALSVTVSAGIAWHGTEDAAGIEVLLQVADQRLTLAKQRGCNRVIDGHGDP